MKNKIIDYTVFFQKEPEGGYTAYVPSLPGCVSYGENLDHAKSMITEAISLYIESLKAHNEEIPTEDNTFFTTVHIQSDYETPQLQTS